jgi:hypothetical protein
MFKSLFLALSHIKQQFRFNNPHYFSGGITIVKSLNNPSDIHLGFFNGNHLLISEMNKKLLKNYRDMGVIDKLEYDLYFDKVNTLSLYQRHPLIVKGKDINGVACLIGINNTTKPWGLNLSSLDGHSSKVPVVKVSAVSYINSMPFKFY